MLKVNAQVWLNKKFSNKAKADGKVSNHSWEILEGELKVEGFINLKVLSFPRNELTSLIVINCPKLTKVDCHNNSLISLDIRSCPKLTELRCSNNPLKKLYLDGILDSDWEKVQKELKKYLKDENFYDLEKWRKERSEVIKLVNISSIERTPSVSSLSTNITGDSNTPLLNLTSSPPLSRTDSEEATNKSILSQTSLQETTSFSSESGNIVTELELIKNKFGDLTEKVNQLEKQIAQLSLINTPRNILLFGRTGNGKSTLANVLTNSNKFKEGKNSVSETRDIQFAEFGYWGTNYRVIDTIGIGDTQLSEEQILSKLAEIAYYLKDGLSQILFVTSGRFEQAETAAFNLLKKTIFADKNIANYVTIICTRFADFQNEEECQKDIDLMAENGGELAEIMELCLQKVIHVNNSRSYKERKKSRAILLSYLAENCQDIYKPKNLEELNERIDKYIEEKREKKQKLDSLDKKDTKNNSEIELLSSEINTLDETIFRQIQQYLEKKEINWKDIAKLGIGGTTALATVAAVVVPLTCKIM